LHSKDDSRAQPDIQKRLSFSELTAIEYRG
jgi:hypothetical protein